MRAASWMAVCAAVLAAVQTAWSIPLDVPAWILLGVTAGFSLSGSV
ncbi:hypothetical protein ACFXJ8_29370 [Nonomuraea sp. NPDC059194]